MIGVLGWLVGVIDVAQFLPQARRVFMLRSDTHAIRSLSVSTWVVATVQSFAWIVYGTAEHLPAIALPNLLIAPVCSGILVVRLWHHWKPV